MGVVQRGNSFQVEIYKKGSRWRRLFKTRDSAAEWEKWALDIIAKGGDPLAPEGGEDGGAHPALPQTLAELLEYTNTHHWANTRSGDDLYHTARRMVETIGPKTILSKLTAFDINAAVLRLQKSGNSNATVNRKLAGLSKMLNIAVEIEALSKKPTFKLFKEAVHRIRVISPEEEKALLTMSEALDPNMRDYIILAMDTGIRLGELLALKVSDCKDNKISVWQTKSGLPRFLPMTTRVKEVVARAEEAGRAFLVPLSKMQIERLWDMMRERMGLSDDDQFVRHAMRHTFCSRLAARGVDIQTIKTLAGHTTITTTQRYMHAFAPVVEDAIKKLEQAA